MEPKEINAAIRSFLKYQPPFFAVPHKREWLYYGVLSPVVRALCEYPEPFDAALMFRADYQKVVRAIPPFRVMEGA